MMDKVYLPDDPRLIENIVCEVKSQGLFDQFRRECMADVDTKPAYQNLRQRVDTSVAAFLNQQDWRPDLNRNQLREKLRKHITESGFLETGVDRIVDQVVNPKISTIFLPKIEDVVYKYLGIEKPVKNLSNDIKLFDANGLLEIKTDLLPTDLEAVSPDSDKKSISQLSDIFNDVNDSNDGINDSAEKIEEFESPAFEPLEGRPPSSMKKEESNDSQLSGISGLTSQDSVGGSDNEDAINNKSSIEKLEESVVIENIKPNSQLSQVSSNSHLSIETGSDRGKTSGVDISEEAQMPEFNDASYRRNTKSEQLTFDNIKKDEIQFEGTERKSLIKTEEYDESVYVIKKEKIENANNNLSDIKIKEELELDTVLHNEQSQLVDEGIIDTLQNNDGWVNGSNAILNDYEITPANTSMTEEDSSDSSRGLVIYGYSESVSQSSDINMKDEIDNKDTNNINNDSIIMKEDGNSIVVAKDEDDNINTKNIKVEENETKLSPDVKLEICEVAEEHKEKSNVNNKDNENPVKIDNQIISDIKTENDGDIQNKENDIKNDVTLNEMKLSKENDKDEVKELQLNVEIITQPNVKTADNNHNKIDNDKTIKDKSKDEKSSKAGSYKSSTSSHSSKYYSKSGSSSSKSQSQSSKTSRSSSSSSSRHNSSSKDKHRSEKSRSISSKSSSSSRDSSSKHFEKSSENYHLSKSSSSYVKRSDSASKDNDKHEKRSHSSCSSSTRDKERHKDRDRDRDRDRKSGTVDSLKKSSSSPSTKEKKKEKLVDDHFSSRDKTCEKRRSTDRDSNDGTGDAGSNNNNNNSSNTNNANNTQQGNNISSNSSTSSQISCDVENNNSTTSPSTSSPASSDVLASSIALVRANVSVINNISDTTCSSNTNSSINYPSTSNDHLSDIVIPQILPPIIVDQMLTPNDNASMELLINNSKLLINSNDKDNILDNTNNNNNNANIVNNNLTIKKKPKFASNFHEARKLMKIRKKMEREEKKNLEKIIVNAKKENPNNYEINKHGPEIEFSSEQGMKPFISNYQNKNCNNLLINKIINTNINHDDNEKELLYFPENDVQYPESYCFINKHSKLINNIKTYYNNKSYYLFKLDDDFENAFKELLSEYKSIDIHNNIVHVTKNGANTIINKDSDISLGNTNESILDTDTDDTIYDVHFDDLDDNDVNDIISDDHDDDINCDLDDDNLMLNDFIDDAPHKRKHEDSFTINNNNNNNDNEKTLNIIKKIKMIGDEDINKSSPTPSDQSTSSKENAFIGKARRVGLPKIKKSTTTVKSVPVSLTNHNMSMRVALSTPTTVSPKITAKTPTSTVTASLPTTTKRDLSFENLKSTSTTSQRYSSDDLYKPRPFVTKGRTRRNRGLDETTAVGIETLATAATVASSGSITTPTLTDT